MRVYSHSEINKLTSFTSPRREVLKCQCGTAQTLNTLLDLLVPGLAGRRITRSVTPTKEEISERGCAGQCPLPYEALVQSPLRSERSLGTSLVQLSLPLSLVQSSKLALSRYLVPNWCIGGT